MSRWSRCITLSPTVCFVLYCTVLRGASKWPRPGHSSGKLTRDYVTPHNCSEHNCASEGSAVYISAKITSHGLLATQRTASLRMYRCTGDNKPSHNVTAAREPRGSREERGLEEEGRGPGEALGGRGGSSLHQRFGRNKRKRKKRIKGQT